MLEEERVLLDALRYHLRGLHRLALHAHHIQKVNGDIYVSKNLFFSKF